MAQLRQQDTNDRTKYRTSLELLLNAEKEVNSLIQAIKHTIDEHSTIGKSLKAQAAEALKAMEDASNGDKGKSRAFEREESPLTEASEEDADLPKNAIGEAHAHKRRALQSRLREGQIILHKIHFLKGDVSLATVMLASVLIFIRFRSITPLARATPKPKTRRIRELNPFGAFS